MLYHLVRWLYTGIYTLLAPLVLALLALRADSRRRMVEYLAGPPRRAPGPLSERRGRPRVWLHAVSVGEALSALPVLAELRNSWPGMEVHLTSTIEDALVVALRSGTPIASARFLPLDLPVPMRLVCDGLRPDLALISETDFWPNMLHVLAQRRVPVFLVNGRISYKIAGLYSRLGGFASRMFGSLDRAFVQTATDAGRLRALGVPDERVLVAGNTKYEASLRALVPGEFEPQIAALLADPRPRLMAGSTHAGEERLVIDAMTSPPASTDSGDRSTPPAARSAVPAGDPGLAPARAHSAALVVLVPRDIRRAAAVAEAARAAGLVPALFSELEPGALSTARAVVVDVLGVLPRLYEGAAVAFIGGSFDGSGGHNFLEAARFAVPVVCGPRMRNFTDDVAEFLRHGALVQGESEAHVARELVALLSDRARARRIGEAGEALLRAHRGAAARTAEAIRARVPWPETHA